MSMYKQGFVTELVVSNFLKGLGFKPEYAENLGVTVKSLRAFCKKFVKNRWETAFPYLDRYDQLEDSAAILDKVVAIDYLSNYRGWIVGWQLTCNAETLSKKEDKAFQCQALYRALNFDKVIICLAPSDGLDLDKSDQIKEACLEALKSPGLIVILDLTAYA